MLVSSYLILKKYLAIYHFIFKRVFPLSLFLIFDFEIQNIKNTVVFPRFITNRSSHWRCAVRKGVFRNFAKFIGKHLCKILFFNSLREKCLYSELFWSAFSRIRIEYGEILRIFTYSVQMRQNAYQNNSKYRHFFTQCEPRTFTDAVTKIVLIFNRKWSKTFSETVT